MSRLFPVLQTQFNNHILTIEPEKPTGISNNNDAAVETNDSPSKQSDLVTPMKEAHQNTPVNQRSDSFKQGVKASPNAAGASIFGSDDFTPKN